MGQEGDVRCADVCMVAGSTSEWCNVIGQRIDHPRLHIAQVQIRP